MRKKINFFVCYSHRNHELVESFLEKLIDVLAPSANYEYSIWKDNKIELGADWNEEILTARDNCDLGLLLISPSFLASKYITETELPEFVSGKKRAIPVMLQPVSFKKHDLKGLGRKQIFRLKHTGFTKPRSYYECSSKRRNDFVLELFEKIEDILDNQ